MTQETPPISAASTSVRETWLAASPWAFHRRTAVLPSSGFSEYAQHLLAGIRTAAASPSGGNPGREADALALETNPEMFYAALLQWGNRFESDDRLTAAAAVYRAVLDAAAHAPAGTEPSAATLETVRIRLEILSGGGSGGARSEFLLRRLAREAIDPATLAGLGVARSAFNLTRLGVLARCATRPGANFWLPWLGASTAATGLGLAAEAAVFPLATRAGHALLGRDLDWSTPALGRELASSFLTLGMLRSLHGGGAALRGRVFGTTPTLAARFGAGAMSQAEMFAGIMLAHRAESAWGLRPSGEGETQWIDALALLVQFNVAGRLSGEWSGAGFAAQARYWEANLPRRSLKFPNFPGLPPLRPAFEGLSRSAGMPEGLRSRMPLDDGISRMTGSGSGNGDGFGPGGRIRRGSGEFPAIALPGESNEVRTFGQLMRRLIDPDLNFKEKIRQGHVIFRYLGEFPATMESELEPIHAYLRTLANATRHEIPFGNRLVIHSTVSQTRIIFSKSLSTGFDMILPGRTAAQPAGAPAARTPLPVPQAAAGRSNSGILPPFVLAPGYEELPIVLRSLEHLAPALRALNQGARGRPPLIIMEGLDSEPRALNDAVAGIPPGTLGPVQLLFPQTRVSFLSRVRDGHLSWERTYYPGWSAAQGRQCFDNLNLKSPEEIYLQIESYARDPGRLPQAKSTLTLGGKLDNREALTRLVEQALNVYRMRGQSLRVELPGDWPHLAFEGRDGKWRDVSPEDNVARRSATTWLPPAPAETTPIPAGERTRAALMRSIAIPITHNGGIDTLAGLLRRAYQDRSADDGPRVLILESKPGDGSGLEPEAPVLISRLNQLASPLRASFDRGTVFQIFDVARRRSFVGEVNERSGALEWSLDNGNEWRIASLRAVRNQAVKIKNPVELYLFLEALPSKSRGNYSEAEAAQFAARELKVLWDGPAPRTFQYDLKVFAGYALVTHVPFGRDLTIDFQDGSAPFRMENSENQLWMENTPRK